MATRIWQVRVGEKGGLLAGGPKFKKTGVGRGRNEGDKPNPFSHAGLKRNVVALQCRSATAAVIRLVWLPRRYDGPWTLGRPYTRVRPDAVPPLGRPGGLQEPILMAKRTRTPPAPGSPPAMPAGRKRPGIIHTSVYLPEAVHEALRVAAFKERRKIHDIVLEGIEMALRKRGRRS